MQISNKDGKYELRLNQFEFDGLHEEIASNFENEEDSFGSELYSLFQVLDEIKKIGIENITITIE